MRAGSHPATEAAETFARLHGHLTEPGVEGAFGKAAKSV